MSDTATPELRTIPSSALDGAGRLLNPESIPLDALINPVEIIKFVQSIAELTQMECSAVLHDPHEPRPIMAGGDIQVVRAPICHALNNITTTYKKMKCPAALWM